MLVLWAKQPSVSRLFVTLACFVGEATKCYKTICNTWLLRLQMSMNKTFFNGDHSIVHGDHKVIKGDYCTVQGNHCTIRGDYCTVQGNHCTVRGDYCTVTGNGCVVFGDYCAINGKKSVASPTVDHSSKIMVAEVVPDFDPPMDSYPLPCI